MHFSCRVTRNFFDKKKKKKTLKLLRKTLSRNLFEKLRLFLSALLWPTVSNTQEMITPVSTSQIYRNLQLS